MAITRVFDHALASAALGAQVKAVIESQDRGLVAQITYSRISSAVQFTKDIPDIHQVLKDFLVRWEVIDHKL